MIRRFLVGLVLAVGIVTGVAAQNSFTVPILQFRQGDTGTVGSIATLAASSNTVVQFDIGPQWQQYSVLQCTLSAATSTGGSVSIWFGDTLGAQSYGAVLAFNGSAASAHQYTTWAPATFPRGATAVGVSARYVYMIISNTDATNAFTSGNWYCQARK